MGAIGRILVLLVTLQAPFAGNQPAKSVHSSLPQQVSIYRDRYGVPHILGDTEQATFFGYGYAQAQDHLLAMMLQYRDAQGRLSEVLGARALGDKLLAYHPNDYRWDGDYLQRLLRTRQMVDQRRRNIDPHVYSLLDAFAQGVNHYIVEHRSSVPGWIDSIRAEDVEALERSNYMRYYSVADGLVKLTGSPRPLPRIGSNHWAVSAARSAGGHILHVGEVHMPWSNRLQLYEAHLITPGKLNVGGIGWFGSPFFLCAFNSDISWSLTYNQPNISDIYEEAVNPDHSLTYLYNGRWLPVAKQLSTFLVRRNDGRFDTVALPLYYTHHGPILRFDPAQHRAFSLKVPNFENVNYSKGLYDLMKARNVFEFKNALSEQLIPRWNFLCTDRQHIYWVHNGVVARRDPKYNWLKPVPGWTSSTEWQGYLPFSANPHLLDPRSGFVQNSNNPPWVSTRNSGIDPLQPAPYYYSYPVTSNAGEQALNTRGERLFGVLTRTGERFSLTQMKSLALDTYILAADVIVPLLNKARLRHSSDRQLSAAMDALRDWNRRAEKDSVAFTYLFYWSKAYSQLYGKSFRRFNEYNHGGISVNSHWEQERAWSALVLAVENLKTKFGKSAVPWGEISRVLRNGSFPLDGTGAFETIHPDFGPEQPDGRIRCDDGWGHLMVVVESTPKQIWTLLPYGESEDPQSPHYNDMARLHSQHTIKRFWFTKTEIAQNTESVWGERTRILRAEF